MDFLKQWCFCLCSALLVAVVLSLFIPKGNMKGFYKLLISAFVFVSFIYPLKDYKHVSLDINETESAEIYKSENEKAFETAVNIQIRHMLEENGVNGADISSCVSVFDSGAQASIESVLIAVPDEYSKEEVKRLALEELGIEAEVKYIGE